MKEQTFKNSNILGYMTCNEDSGVLYTDDFDISIFVNGDTFVGQITTGDNDDVVVAVKGRYLISSILIRGRLMNLEGEVTINGIDYTFKGSRVWIDGDYIDTFFPPTKI